MSVLSLDDHLQRISRSSWRPARAGSAVSMPKKLASEAYQQGFTSEQEITLYANVFGYLAGQPLIDHPDIVELLTVTHRASPLSTRATRCRAGECALPIDKEADYDCQQPPSRANIAAMAKSAKTSVHPSGCAP